MKTLDPTDERDERVQVQMLSNLLDVARLAVWKLPSDWFTTWERAISRPSWIRKHKMFSFHIRNCDRDVPSAHQTAARTHAGGFFSTQTVSSH